MFSFVNLWVLFICCNIFLFTGTNQCPRARAPCQQGCDPLQVGYQCTCRQGYRLVNSTRCVGQLCAISIVGLLQLRFDFNSISIRLRFGFHSTTTVWLSGNVVGQINEVTLRRAGLMLRWVTVQGVCRLGVQPSHPGQLSLVFPPWVDEMSTSDGYGCR